MAFFLHNDKTEMHLAILLLLGFCCVTHFYALFFIRHYAVLFTNLFLANYN